MDRATLESLAALYALDLLPPPERAAVEAALPHHAELARLVAEQEHPEAGASSTEGLARLMAQAQADEEQRDLVTAEDPRLRADLTELLALYSVMKQKLHQMTATASLPPPEPGG